MKSILGLLTLTLCFHLTSVEAKDDIDVADLKGSIIAGKIQCGSRFQDYNFLKEYNALFQAAPSVKDMLLLQEVSQEVQKDLKKTCDNERSLNTWNHQTCYHFCQKKFLKPNSISTTKIYDQCSVSCTSLARRINSLQGDLAIVMRENLVEECDTAEGLRVNGSSRSIQKDKDMGTGNSRVRKSSSSRQ